MTLDQMKTGESGVIVEGNCERNLRRRRALSPFK